MLLFAISKYANRQKATNTQIGYYNMINWLPENT